MAKEAERVGIDPSYDHSSHSIKEGTDTRRCSCIFEAPAAAGKGTTCPLKSITVDLIIRIEGCECTAWCPSASRRLVSSWICRKHVVFSSFLVATRLSGCHGHCCIADQGLMAERSEAAILHVACCPAAPTKRRLQATTILVLVVFFLIGAAWQGYTSSHVSC